MEKFNQKEGKPFNGLMVNIKRYFNTLFRDEKIDTEKRIQMYYNMVEHYTGNLDNCSHGEITKKIKIYTGNDVDNFKSKFTKFLKENDHYARK